MHKFTRKAVAVTVGTVVLLSGAGVAFAYWTTTGSGTGTAGTAATTTALTVAQTSAPAGLAPDAPAQPLNFSVNNPGSGAVQITGVVIAFAATTGCVAGDFTITQPTLSATTIAPGTTKTFSSGAGGDVVSTLAAIRMIDTGADQNSCKNATVNLTYTTTP